MELIKQELNIPKESKEVIDFLDQVYEQAQDGVQLDDITELMEDLLKAIQGADKLEAEVKSANKADVLAYLIYKIGNRIG